LLASSQRVAFEISIPCPFADPEIHGHIAASFIVTFEQFGDALSLQITQRRRATRGSIAWVSASGAPDL